MLHAILIIFISEMIYLGRRSNSDPMVDPDAPRSPAALREAILEELFAYAPARQMHLMRHWPGGRMSLVHLNVLVVLTEAGPLPMNRLAELLDVSQASATGIVDRMEQRGLVTRERDDGDRRIVRVVLSPQGRDLIAGAAAERRDKLARLVDSLASDDAAALLQGLRAMHRARETLFQQDPPIPNATPEEPR